MAHSVTIKSKPATPPRSRSPTHEGSNNAPDKASQVYPRAFEEVLDSDRQRIAHSTQPPKEQPIEQNINSSIHNDFPLALQSLDITRQFFGVVEEHSSVEYRAFVPIYHKVQTRDVPYPLRGDRAQEHSDGIKALCECDAINQMLI